MTPMPDRIAKRPVDARGYPVPWFVAWVNGQPEFRIADPAKWVMAVKLKVCWVCGEPLGRWLAFPIGPMCAITRTTPEPPSHVDCAEWSIQNCPFLSQPRAVRRDGDLPTDAEAPAGMMIRRNPGVVCLWVTRGFEVFTDDRGKPLITVGAPERVTWWAEGRQATREEVQASMDGGLPILLQVAKQDGPFAVEQLGKQTRAVEALLPA